MINNNISIINQLLASMQYVACYNTDNPLYKIRSGEVLRNLIVNIDCEIGIIDTAIRLIKDGGHRWITKRLARGHYTDYYRYTEADLTEEKYNLTEIRQLIRQYSVNKGLVG